MELAGDVRIKPGLKKVVGLWLCGYPFRVLL
jgi:hypothetical protein